jgi:hypothetical protein
MVGPAKTPIQFPRRSHLMRISGQHRPWSTIPRDYRLTCEDGTRKVMTMQGGETVLAPWHGPSCEQPECWRREGFEHWHNGRAICETCGHLIKPADLASHTHN